MILKLTVIKDVEPKRTYSFDFDETEGNVMLLTIGEHEYLVDITGLILHENHHEEH